MQSDLQKPSLSMQSSRRYMLGRYSKLFPSAASGEPVSLYPLFQAAKCHRLGRGQLCPNHSRAGETSPQGHQMSAGCPSLL